MENKKNTVQVELLHPKEQIYGLGKANIKTVFWWHGDRNSIDYHFNPINTTRQARVQQLKTPEGITKQSHQILSYCEETNSLVLKDRRVI
jgi:hypothetical protein